VEGKDGWLVVREKLANGAEPGWVESVPLNPKEE